MDGSRTKFTKVGTPSRLGPLLRSWITAVLLASYQLHPGIAIGQRLFPEPEPPSLVNENVIDVRTMLHGSVDPGGFDFVNKNITFLIHDPMWNEFWRRDERILLGYPVYGELASRSKSFRVVVFRNEQELLSELNRDRSEDVLILGVHGSVNDPGSFRVDENSIRKILPLVQDRPLKVGAELFYFVCDFGELSPDRLAGDEPWIELARKKLNPNGGKAVAATAIISTPALQTPWRAFLNDVGRTGFYGFMGPLGQLAARGQLSESDMRMLDRVALRHEFDTGIRVYDRATEQIRFFSVDENGLFEEKRN